MKRILLAALLFAAYAVGFVSFPTAAQAANTCRSHSVDGFKFGVCLNQLHSNSQARAELYIDSVNQNVLTGCTIELEIWFADPPALTDDEVPCTPPAQGGPQRGTTWSNPCSAAQNITVHADAYLHAANGGFRVGPSAPVTLRPSC